MGNDSYEAIDAVIRHWLLNLAVEIPLDLRRILPAVQAQGLNVLAVPGCEKRDYARGVIQLHESGMIELSSKDAADDVNSSDGVAQILDRFINLSKYDPDTSPRHFGPVHKLPSALQVTYKITESGGREWEGCAKPDWDHFVNGSDDYVSGELVSFDKEHLIAYMGWYPEIAGSLIQLDTINWETLRNFNILYWKQLPVVHRVSFQLQPSGKRWGSDSAPQWFWDWYLSTAAWYTKPWLMPNWPTK
jgi:hypothetical protein